VSRLYRALVRMRRQGDRAAIGTVQGLPTNGCYKVLIAGTLYEGVPAAGGASAFDDQSVAVLVSGETGRPIAMLGPVSP